jgi:hypothetical protein
MSTTTTPILYNTTSGFTFSNTSQIQISANAASLINNTGYSTANPWVLETFQMQASALSGFSETASYSGSDATGYTILVNGADYYWNGSAWVSSNGTYAQSNTASTINSHCSDSSMGTLLGSGNYVQVRAFIHSATGATSPSITGISLTYTFAAIRPSSPTQCTVWCYLEDILGNIVGSVQNAYMSVAQKDPFIYGQFVVAPFTKSVAFNSSGYAVMILDETTTPGVPVQFSISYNIGTTSNQINFIPCMVPNSGAVALTSISTFLNQTATTSGVSTITSFVPSEYQTNITNNASSVALPTLIFSPTSYSAVLIRFSIRRQDTGEFYYQIGRIFLRWSQSASTWSIHTVGDYGASGPSTGVTFSVSTGAGPSYLPAISYSSDNMTGGGTYIGTMRYKVIDTFLLEQ